MARVKITCNDGFLFSALGYSIVQLLFKWGDYNNCEEPMNLFLLIDYTVIMLFRTSHFVAHRFSDSENIILKKTTEFIKIGILYLFFVAWTIVGTVWYSKSSSCLPEGGQSFTVKVWLALCYVWIVAYALVLVVQHCWLSRDERFADARHHPFPLSIITMSNLRGLNEEQICSIPSFQAPQELLFGKEMCTVCIDGFTKNDLVKRLNCGHLFHASCIDEWLERKASCPVCRAEIGEENDNQVDIHGPVEVNNNQADVRAPVLV